MLTAKQTECNATQAHERGNKTWTVTEMDGRRYTVCAHPMGNEWCGSLIDVTDGPVVICCGDEQRHAQNIVLGLD